MSNPFDQFDQSTKGNPFDQFDAPKPAAPAQKSAPVATPPASSSGPTYLEPRSLSQVGSDIADFGRVAANTLGAGDMTLAAWKSLYHDIAGDASQANALPANLAAEKAKTAQSSQNIGPAASLAARMIGGAPVAGATGATMATALAPYTGRWLGGVLGSGIEGAAVAGGSAAGRGDPILPAAAIGGIGGAATGVPGGVTGRGTLPTTPTAADFDQTAQGVYRDMSKVGYNPSTVDAAYSSATPSLTKSQLADISPGFRQTIIQQRKINGQGNATSADSIGGFGRALQSTASTPGDRVLAGRISDNLDGVLDSAPTVTGHAPGYASDLQDQANKAIGQRNDLNRIEGWEQTAAQDPSKDVSKQATNWLNTEEGKRLAPPGSLQNQAYNFIADQSARAGFIPWWAKHYIIGSLAGIGAGEASSMITGDESSPVTRGLEGLIEGLTMGGAMHGYSAMTGGKNTAAQQRNIAAARATLGSGQLYSPVIAPTQVSRTGDALRRLYSQMTPGALPGTNP